MAAITRAGFTRAPQDCNVQALDLLSDLDLARVMRVNRTARGLVREVCRVRTFRAFDAATAPEEGTAFLDIFGLRELFTHASAVIQIPHLRSYDATNPEFLAVRANLSGSIVLTPNLQGFNNGPAIIVFVNTPIPDPSGDRLTAFILRPTSLVIAVKYLDGGGMRQHWEDWYGKMKYCADVIRGIPRGVFLGAREDTKLREGECRAGEIVTLDRPREAQPDLAISSLPTP